MTADVQKNVYLSVICYWEKNPGKSENGIVGMVINNKNYCVYCGRILKRNLCGL